MCSIVYTCIITTIFVKCVLQCVEDIELVIREITAGPVTWLLITSVFYVFNIHVYKHV